MLARTLTASLAAAAVAAVATFAAPPAAGAAAPAGPGSAGGAVAESPRPGGYRPTGRLVVRFKDGVDAPGRARALARVGSHGRAAEVLKHVPGLNAALLKVDDPRAVHALLREDPAVRYVEAETRYRALAADAQQPERTAAGLPSFATRDAGTALTGAGTDIAIIDSGVDSSNGDLAGKVVAAAAFADADDPTDPTDHSCDVQHCPHGTGVAAVAAAADGNGGVVGAAPGAAISSYSVFRRYVTTDAKGKKYEELAASTIDIAAALDAVRVRAQAHPELVVVNLSLGNTFDSLLVREAISALRAAAPQVTVVVAAGNDAAERPTFPAGDPGVVSVGASGVQGTETTCSFTGATTVAPFSNRGDVDIVAPGACIRTWYRADDPLVVDGYTGSPVVRKVDGTSFAAPMVVGVVALIAQQGVTGDAARAALLAGATKPATPNVTTGVGFLNAPGALAAATGTAAYTAAFVDRGGQVANQVGRRTVEVLQVQPGVGATAPETVAPVLPAGRGTVTPVVDGETVTGGVRRTTYTYAVPAANLGGVVFTMTAGTLKVPFRLLDPTDGFEGLPNASGDQSSVGLTFGTRSAYVRSAYVGAGTNLHFDYTYGDSQTSTAVLSDLFVWEPSTSGGTADAAMAPIDAAGGGTYEPSSFDYPVSVTGRHLFGWVLFSEADSSSSATKYVMKPGYLGPGAAISAPALASSVSPTGPFVVSWSGYRGKRFEVEYTTKVKSGTSWVYGTWRTWKVTGSASSATFGTAGLVKGQTYWFRLRTFDAYGNPSLYATTRTVVPQDDLSSSMYYTGSWAKRALGNRWFGYVHQSAARGAYVQHRTDTSQFTVIGDKCPSCGQFAVYVDGVYKGTVDTRAGGTYARQVLWTSASLGAPKGHTIKLVVVGTSGRPYVLIDGIGTLR
ncbi:MAG TPA: S8/S53 family peptidase [Mycobacteriales bacterium]|jgi:hypothetical protein